MNAIQTRKWARGLLRGLWFKAFLFFERLGLHVLRKTSYSPIQDYRWLAQNQKFWITPCSLVGIDWRLNTQLEWLGKICRPYHSEVVVPKCYVTRRQKSPLNTRRLKSSVLLAPFCDPIQ